MTDTPRRLLTSIYLKTDADGVVPADEGCF